MDKIEILIKEYDVLRQEILSTMHNRSQIVSFGLATIGALIGGILTSYRYSQNEVIAVAFFSYLIPITSILILFVWHGELTRMVRAANFLVNLEQRINLSYGESLLTWENWLRISKMHNYRPYISVMILFAMFSMSTPFIGFMITKIKHIDIVHFTSFINRSFIIFELKKHKLYFLLTIFIPFITMFCFSIYLIISSYRIKENALKEVQ